jgi:hypothetical protein
MGILPVQAGSLPHKSNQIAITPFLVVCLAALQPVKVIIPMMNRTRNDNIFSDIELRNNRRLYIKIMK